MSLALNLRKSIFIILAATLAISSCSRDKVVYKEYELTDNDKGFSTDFGAMEFINDDVEAMANIAAVNGNPSFMGCEPVVSHDTGLNRIIINFGGDCQETVSKIRRSGKIRIDYTREYWDSGSVHTITFDDYYYDGKRLTGYKTIENRGYDDKGRWFYSIVVSDTLHLGSNNGFISFASERTRTWLNGFNSLANTSDDVYQLTGSGSIKRANDQYGDFNIINDLVVGLDCKWVKSGTLQMIPRDGDPRILDFGGGDCDNKGTLEINGKMFEVEL